MFRLHLHIYFILSMTWISLAKNSTKFINPDFIPRVVNGWPGKLGDVPYQVAFKTLINRRMQLYSTFCGGSIIGPNKILSAAHCFAENPTACQRLFKSTGSKRSLSGKYAVAGQLLNRDYYYPDNAGKGQWRSLAHVAYPWTYKFPKDDIAIVYTRYPFVFNNIVNYIPYAVLHRDYVGECLVSGFGRMAFGQRAEVLYLAHLTLLPAHQCAILFRRKMRKFICTATRVADVGKGDSGGPLVCAKTGDYNDTSPRGVLVGVVSGNKPGYCSFFTRVSAYRGYIARGGSYVIRPGRIIYIVITIKATFALF